MLLSSRCGRFWERPDGRVAARKIRIIKPMVTARKHSATNTTTKKIPLVAMVATCQMRLGAASEKRPVFCRCVSASAKASAASGAGSSASPNIRWTILATASFCAAP